MLYKATQTVIEKAPVDAITGNSRNTLAENKLGGIRCTFKVNITVSII
jgi:predicted NAD-dependent protein-ADP-ribosyltransferase YbiA (DUF1768 family)